MIMIVSVRGYWGVMMVTCEVRYTPDIPLLVRIITMVDAVVDYVILRKEESSYNKVQLTKISYDIRQSAGTIAGII